MTDTTVARPAPTVVFALTDPIRGRRRIVDTAATVGLVLSFLLALIPLGFVMYYVASKGLAIMGAEFLTEDIPRQARAVGPGMGPAVVGTIVITVAASVMSIPLGVLGAIYLNEYGRRNRLARLIRLMSDVMTGVPSIIMGLFVYIIWVRRVGEQSGFAGALALACLMLPIVIRTTEEMLRLVPDELRQGSLALGATRSRTTMSVVLPTALPGIVSGAMLAVARAAGETAPVLFTIFIVYSPNWRLSGANTTLSAQIFKNAQQPFPGGIERAWGAALTLVVLVFVLTFIARFVAARFALKQQ